jgi:hypothetical protein
MSDFSYPEPWKPNPGDVLEGEITELTMYEGGAYGAYPIVTVKQDDGVSLALHAFHTVARDELAAKDVQIGERIAILYAGKQRTKAGDGEYEGYRVKLPGRTPKKFNWDGDELDSTDSSSLETVPPNAADADDEIPF